MTHIIRYTDSSRIHSIVHIALLVVLIYIPLCSLCTECMLSRVHAHLALYFFRFIRFDVDFQSCVSLSFCLNPFYVPILYANSSLTYHMHSYVHKSHHRLRWWASWTRRKMCTYWWSPIATTRLTKWTVDCENCVNCRHWYWCSQAHTHTHST